MRWLVPSVVMVLGCAQSWQPAPDLDGPDMGPACEPLAAVDLLLVVDDSPDMEEAQARFAAALGPFLQTLETASSVRIGLIASDMGTGPTGACAGDPRGRDGLLVATGDVADAACAASYDPPWVDLVAGSGAPRQAVECLFGSIGTGGCGFERPLDATLRTVVPASATLEFAGVRGGHRDGAHAGFFREDALLAIMMVGSEDDCSSLAEGFYDADFPSPIGERCAARGELLRPGDEYLEALGAVVPANRVLVAAITGAPLAPVAEQNADAFDALLEADAMQERLGESAGNIAPACTGPGGAAPPGRRIVSFARDVAARGGLGRVESVCAETYAPFLDEVAAAVATRVAGTCG